MSIVSINVPYNSTILRQNLISLVRTFPFLNIQTVGNSILGDDIWVVRLGKGPKQVFYSASIHANEWITTPILMKFIEDYSNAYINNSDILGYSIRELFSSTSIYIMPMVNPDGVNLVTNNIPTNSQAYDLAQNISNNFPNIPFPNGWKANIKGVDLNLQFPAGWDQAKQIKYEQGFTSPAPRDFVGYGPLTEPESLAIYNFTLSHNFNLVIAYHTQGKEIYWNFQNINPPRGLAIANRFSNSSGYSVENVPFNSSFAGYKDWFIQNYNKPGYTIEAGIGQNPLPLSQFNEIYTDNLGILLLGAIL